jgi:hypothetical protein
MATRVAPTGEAAEGGDPQRLRLPVRERWRQKDGVMAAESYVRVLMFHVKQPGLSRERASGG